MEGLDSRDSGPTGGLRYSRGSLSAIGYEGGSESVPDTSGGRREEVGQDRSQSLPGCAVIHPENCRDESVKGNTAPVQVTRITLPPARDLVMGTILAIALLGNIFLYAYAKDAKTTAWVTADALQKFQTEQLPELQSRINTAEELVKAYGLKESLNVDNHYQPGASPQAAGSDRRSHQ